MTTTTFKGARYITKFADPIEWDATRAYEAIESVQYNGFTYISKQPVPVGVQIDNEAFWLLWADPNAQMEQLRQLVSQYADDVDTLENSVNSLNNTVSDLGNTVDGIDTQVDAIEETVNKLDASYIDFGTTAGNIIYKIPENKVTEKFTVTFPEGFYGQGMCYDGTYVYIAATNSGNTGYIGKYDINGTLINSIQSADLKHANGLYYYDGNIYCATITNGIVILDSETLAIDRTVSITGYAPVGVSVSNRSYSQSGISGTSLYYYVLTNNGNMLEIANNVISRIQSLPGNIHTQQGMCVKDNILLLPRSVNYYAAGNIIDVFDLYGERICSILLPMVGELEDCDISSDGRTLYFNISNTFYTANVENILPTYLNNVIEAQQGKEIAITATITPWATNTAIPETISLPVEAAIADYNEQLKEIRVCSTAGMSTLKKRANSKYDLIIIASGSAFIQLETLVYNSAYSSGNLVLTLDPDASYIAKFENNGTYSRTKLSDQASLHQGTFAFPKTFMRGYRLNQVTQ